MAARDATTRTWAAPKQAKALGYSVPSRLMGEKVEVRLYLEHVEVWYAQLENYEPLC